MGFHDGSALDGETADREARLHRLTELFAPHVRDLVGEEARKRTLVLPMGRLDEVARQWSATATTTGNIIARALAGEAKMIAWEWTLLLTEHAMDGGRKLDLSTLDDAMLPPLADDLSRIFHECCGRRMAGPALTRVILGRVRATLPNGHRLPADALAVLVSRGIVVNS